MKSWPCQSALPFKELRTGALGGEVQIPGPRAGAGLGDIAAGGDFGELQANLARLGGGTPQHALDLQALEWLAGTGIEVVAEREHRLGARLLAGLLAVPGLTLHGPRDGSNRLSVFALNLAGWDNGTLALELSDRYGIESRPGLHCSPLAHRTLGTFPQGALRLSPGYFNTPEEMDRTVRALEELAREGR